MESNVEVEGIQAILAEEIKKPQALQFIAMKTYGRQKNRHGNF